MTGCQAGCAAMLLPSLLTKPKELKYEVHLEIQGNRSGIKIHTSIIHSCCNASSGVRRVDESHLRHKLPD